MSQRVNVGHNKKIFNKYSEQKGFKFCETKKVKIEIDKHQLNFLISELNESCFGEVMREVCNYLKKFWGGYERAPANLQDDWLWRAEKVKTVSRMNHC